MKILAHIGPDHNLWLAALAISMCLTGSIVAVQLIRRTVGEKGIILYLWCFLSAVSAGSTIWATHFVAMLGYDPGVPVTFDGTLTILSAILAVGGTGLGIVIGTALRRWGATIVGGGTFGLAIAAVHYVGMVAYRPAGLVQWDRNGLVASLTLAVVLSAGAFDRIGRDCEGRRFWLAVVLLTSAIVGLHFVGMAAFDVMPIPGSQPGTDSAAFTAMASAGAAVALLIAGTGVSTHLVEKRTRSDSQERLHFIAMHDSLTGTANRRAYEEALRSACAELPDGRPMALLLLDLDGFKGVNDTLGHPVGDEVLRRVARRLHGAVRKSDQVARIGGDEFAVIAHCLVGETEVEDLAQRIVESLAKPFVIDGEQIEIGASVGVALAPVHGETVDTLSAHADIALYTAKRQGKRCFCMFDTEQGRAVEERRHLEADLRRACLEDDFFVVYQPIVDAASGGFSGAEALVRWKSETRGAVGPDVFIPLAEEIGLISRIGTLVLQTACRDAAAWPEDLSVAVNLSPVQLHDPNLVDMVVTALHEGGLDARRLELEITETALLGDDDQALRTLTRLRQLGVCVSLDDFGTGYSSLSYLHRFPINRIKIDRSFIQRLPDDADSISIVRAMAQLAGGLHIKITAEGIESEQQKDLVSQHGCDHLQGYLFSRPIAADRIGAMFGATPPAISAVRPTPIPATTTPARARGAAA